MLCPSWHVLHPLSVPGWYVPLEKPDKTSGVGELGAGFEDGVGEGDRGHLAVEEPHGVVDGEAGSTELAESLPVARQAVAKHRATLAEAGLVTSDRQGRELRYQLTPEPLAEAVSWMASVGGQWDERLQALASYLETGTPRPKRRRAGF